MASSSSIVSVFDAHRFRKAHNEKLFDSYARRRKVIPEVGFNLEDDEYPKIMEQIALRGWRRLSAPLVSDEEAAVQEELPYKSFVRGKEIDFSPNNIRRVMRFKRETAGAQTDYKTHQALNQRLDEVLADLCILGATWKLSSSQPPVPIQLRMTELQPLARGWQEFIIHSLVPKGNKSEITTSRAILIHTIMQGEDVRAEKIIADNMVTIAQGLASNGNLAHPSTIYKLCKDASVPLREFTRTPRIPSLSYTTAKRMETIRFGKSKRSLLKRSKPRRHMALERQGRDIVEIRKQVNLWTNNVSSKEAYACWAQQQANPNLSEVPITQIPDIMRTNVEKGRPLFHGFLKSDYRASSSSHVDPEEPILLWTAPPSPHFRPPYPPSN
ncbi:hypothetical protein PIB30_078726 [Stylosanthes scabra]|uniref:Putative plant transposon protein domain-containing protein n=1 Tax=Stylosanthes scabra TaxID=79078 RepID=A0ABU6WUB8_9FABA|nr:hypothetical protein [Stylosanthes scabra]